MSLKGAGVVPITTGNTLVIARKLLVIKHKVGNINGNFRNMTDRQTDRKRD